MDCPEVARLPGCFGRPLPFAALGYPCLGLVGDWLRLGSIGSSMLSYSGRVIVARFPGSATVVNGYYVTLIRWAGGSLRDWRK